MMKTTTHMHSMRNSHHQLRLVFVCVGIVFIAFAASTTSAFSIPFKTTLQSGLPNPIATNPPSLGAAAACYTSMDAPCLKAWQRVSSSLPPKMARNSKGSCRAMSSSNEPDVEGGGDGDDEIVARRIIVKGDVQGGYYRACVLNEAGKFRRLVGTMSPPDDSSDEAEIYVEGKRNMVEGFVRWCQRSKVGLNQLVVVTDVHAEEPTGLYEGFYGQTKS